MWKENEMKAVLLIIVVLTAACNKVEMPKDCSQTVTCWRTFANYSDCTPRDGHWDNVHWDQDVDPGVSVCDTSKWIMQTKEAEKALIDAADDDFKNFIHQYPNQCGCY